MENENEIDTSSSVESGETETTETSTETIDVEAIKKERDELATTNRQLFERAKKAEGFVKVDGKWVKAPKAEEAIATAQKLEAKTGELSETQLDYLDLKGITNEEDIAIIQKVMQRTGKTVREALADDYVTSKLAEAQKTREVQNAMPSSSKRTGQTETNDVDFHLARYEQTGELPKDFAMRSKVIEAKELRLSDNIPPWHR